MRNKKPSILLVDDESYNLMILEECFQDYNYQLTEAENGEQAWELLKNNPEEFDVVLLDWMMPKMDGLEVLNRIKAAPELKHIHVIMQTARAGKSEIQKGMDAGAYYYLTKPYQEQEIQLIVETAVNDSQCLKSAKEKIKKNDSLFGLLTKGVFEYKTLEECHILSTLLANTYPDPEKILAGLSALMMNALEHGNLDIGYEEKTHLINQKTWTAEIERRYQLPENNKKRVFISYKRDAICITLTIEDEGIGFDWCPYLSLDSERIKDNHGRGILTALNSFDKLEYLGEGNKVMTQIQL